LAGEIHWSVNQRMKLIQADLISNEHRFTLGKNGRK